MTVRTFEDWCAARDIPLWKPHVAISVAVLVSAYLFGGTFIRLFPFLDLQLANFALNVTAWVYVIYAVKLAQKEIPKMVVRFISGKREF